MPQDRPLPGSAEDWLARADIGTWRTLYRQRWSAQIAKPLRPLRLCVRKGRYAGRSVSSAVAGYPGY